MDRATMQSEVKKALSETVLLKDGRFGFVISELGGSTGFERWECHVCQKTITTERAMLMHLSHPLHMNNMRAPNHNPRQFKMILSKDEVRKLINKDKKEVPPDEVVAPDEIDPDEPIPPGMEDIVYDKPTQIQDTIDIHPGPLIGLEYIVELVSSDPDALEPSYICLLCEKKGDPRSVMVHLTSHNHSLKYISCFFRTAGNSLNLMPWNREYRRGVMLAVNRIAKEIEKIHGRLKPTSACAETFQQKRNEILKNIDSKDHFRESATTTFIEYCNVEKIRELNKLAESSISRPGNRVLVDSEERPSVVANQKPRMPESRAIEPKEVREPRPAGKLSFTIGKPTRSLGQGKPGGDNPDSRPPEVKKEADKPVARGEDGGMLSMSSISSDSDSEGDERRSPGGGRMRKRSRSRSGGPYSRDRSPYGRGGGRRPSPPRKRSPSYYRDMRGGYPRDMRYKSRSRSPGRGGKPFRPDRYHQQHFRKGPYQRERRSPSWDRARIYEGRRRRSNSMERDRRHGSPYGRKSSRSPGRSSPYRNKYRRSPEQSRKKETSEFEKKMQAYRTKLHELEVEMDNKLKYYKERPEKHPQYSDEWKNFWNRRYKELQQEGKDPTGYDFKPEWIIFWEERVKELHEEEVAMKKEDLKEFLPKPEEKKGPSSDLQDISPPTPESVTVDDIKNTWKALTGSDIKAPPKARSPTPVNTTDSRMRSPVVRRSPSPWEDRNSSSSMPMMMNKPRKSTYTADPTIVHVLRMLSVIEHQLGSLAPKSLELLSKTILMEREKSNSSLTLLQESDIHIFFETVKEKVRGQLIAGIVQRNLVSSCRSIIHTIENMLDSHPLKPKPPPSKPVFTPIQPEPVKVAGVGLVNKMAVAQQIAEVLISQGKTDVSQHELEELINAVTGIASSSNVNANQSSTAFFSQLNIQKSTAAPHINELLSNLISSAQEKAGGSVPSSVKPAEPPALLPAVASSVAPPSLATPLTASKPSQPLLTAPISSASVFGTVTTPFSSSTTTPTTSIFSSSTSTTPTAASIFASIASTVSKSTSLLTSTPTVSASSTSLLTKPLISERPVELKSFSGVINPAPPVSPLKVAPTSLSLDIASQNSTKAFSEAVSAAKATVSEQALSTPAPLSKPPPNDKPLFPIGGQVKKEEPSPVKEEYTNPNEKLDDDLRERLMKFKTLSRDEQQGLILLLKDLEKKEPERVEKLRKYVAMGLTQAQPAPPTPLVISLAEPENKSRLSPFSSRGSSSANPGREGMIVIESDNEDDDDYSVEDVYKSVTEKLKKQEPEKKPEVRLNMDDEENTNSSLFSNPSRPLSPPPGAAGQAPQKSAENALAPQAQPDPSPVPQVALKAGWPRNMYMHPGEMQRPSSVSPQDQQYRKPPPPGQQNQFTPPRPQPPQVNQYRPTPPSSAQQYGNQQQQYPGGEMSNSYQQQGGGYQGGQNYMQNQSHYNQQQYPPQPPYQNQQPPYHNPQQPYQNSQQSYQNSQQPYQGQQPPYNNYNSSYNYQRPQGQGYYGNYRQY